MSASAARVGLPGLGASGLLAWALLSGGAWSGVAQDGRQPVPPVAGKGAEPPKTAIPGGLPPAAPKGAADPLGGGGVGGAGGAAAFLARGTGKVKFRMASYDNAGIAATYYPSRLKENAAIVILVHETTQNSRDFETPLDDLQGRTLAEELQNQGYAVLLFDLRGQGNSVGPALGPGDATKGEAAKGAGAGAAAKGGGGGADAGAGAGAGGAEDRSPERLTARRINDLQAIYEFLTDRHNRREFNLSRLAVVGFGTGANLALGWAASPRAATASPRPVSDLSALVLVSPQGKLERLEASRGIREVARRVPTLVLTGEKHEESTKVAEELRGEVERHPKGKVTFIAESPLQGSRLLRFEKGVVDEIRQFLDGTVKFRDDPWTPRYGLRRIPALRPELVPPRPGSGQAAGGGAAPGGVAPQPGAGAGGGGEARKKAG